MLRKCTISISITLRNLINTFPWSMKLMGNPLLVFHKINNFLIVISSFHLTEEGECKQIRINVWITHRMPFCILLMVLGLQQRVLNKMLKRLKKLPIRKGLVLAPLYARLLGEKKKESFEIWLMLLSWKYKKKLIKKESKSSMAPLKSKEYFCFS